MRYQFNQSIKMRTHLKKHLFIHRLLTSWEQNKSNTKGMERKSNTKSSQLELAQRTFNSPSKKAFSFQ